MLVHDVVHALAAFQEGERVRIGCGCKHASGA